MYRALILSFLLLSGYASAHQFTPTYPKMKQSHTMGVLTTQMMLFNSRKDISYYSVGVYDADWNPVDFATSEKLFKVDYLSRKFIDIYIRANDKSRAVYICSRSKILKEYKQVPVISSRICSKIK